jgi:hypothetical protein
MPRVSTLAALAVAATLVSASGAAAPAFAEHPFLREKPRILVDKVLMADNQWVMTAEHVQEIKAAGFNVVSPRLGGTDPARVRQVAAMARDNGMFYVAWMRGSLDTTKGLKYVYPDGHDCDVYSPNSDELWDWLEKTILEHARISLEIPAMTGSFLDFENYARGGSGNHYDLSYDERILAEFATSAGLTLPALAPGARATWLRDQGLEKRFAEFQIAAWRQRARHLRQAVDAVNPRFLLLVYPAPGTRLITAALYPEWGTAQAPLVLCDASTYGRPTQFTSEPEALAANRKALTEAMRVPQEAGIPHVTLGGIDPVCEGADPEFCAKNASMIAAAAGGYWVFYEGPSYRKDHPEYFRWFKQANDDIASGALTLWQQPRSQPENLGETVVTRKTDRLQVAVYNSRRLLQDDLEATGAYEVHALRGMSLEYLRHFDAVILQNFNAALAPDHPISRNLRQYVEQGGGLLFGHDTAWFMESPFPEIAVRARPQHKVEAARHVVDSTLVVAATPAALAGLKVGQQYTTEFGDHMIFTAGPKGQTVVRNLFADPVYVVGEAGKGRVVYSGCFYGYKANLSGAEREVLLGLVGWLCGGAKK